MNTWPIISSFQTKHRHVIFFSIRHRTFEKPHNALHTILEFFKALHNQISLSLKSLLFLESFQLETSLGRKGLDLTRLLLYLCPHLLDAVSVVKKGSHVSGEKSTEPVSKLVHVRRDRDVSDQLGDQKGLPLEAVLPERDDGGERVDPLTETETPGDASELRHVDRIHRDPDQRGEGADHLLPDRERRLGGVAAAGGGGGDSRVEKLDDEIRRRGRSIASLIWRETGVRVLVVVVVSVSVVERRGEEVSTVG